MVIEDGQREIALLLDWENIRFGLQERKLTPNISAIKDEAQSLGRVVVARAYADFQNYTMSNDPRRLYASGIEPVYVPGRTYDDGRGGAQSAVRKNSVDIKLTADCVEFCHRYPNIDVYMLVSGDGDFIHLVNSLRPYGKFVAIVALSWSASPRLTESADWVRFYDLDVEPSARREPAIAAAETRGDALPEEMTKIFEGIRDIVTHHERPLVLATLKPLLTQRIGEVDERRFGHTKFKPLVMEAQEAGYVRVVTEGLVDWVMPVHSDFESVVEQPDRLDLNGQTDSAAQTGDEGATFETLPHTLKMDIIDFCDTLERRSRYVTFRYLIQNLDQQPWIQLDNSMLRTALNSAIQMGMFNQEGFEDFDEFTGLYRHLPTLRLNRDHALVQEALGPAA